MILPLVPSRRSSNSAMSGDSFDKYEELFKVMVDEWPKMRQDISEIKATLAGFKGRVIGAAVVLSAAASLAVSLLT